MKNVTYVSIRELGPTRFDLCVIWSGRPGPHWVSGYSTSRANARKRATEIAGSDRKLVHIDRIYEEHKRRVTGYYD